VHGLGQNHHSFRADMELLISKVLGQKFWRDLFSDFV